MGGTSLTWRRGNKSNGIGIHADMAPMGVLDVLNDAWTATNAQIDMKSSQLRASEAGKHR